jgi:SAM-dependent methyltransferase
MTDDSPTAPAPFSGERFQLLRSGIYDDASTRVFVDAELSFAMLDPIPAIDYTRYVPRHVKLGLADAERRRAVIDDRLAKICSWIPTDGTVLEVGAGDGSFCARLLQSRPQLRLVAVEPDESTHAARTEVAGLVQYKSLADARSGGERATAICMFHVFEHIHDPAHFLGELFTVAAPGARLLIEIPSLDDPLLTVYRCQAYENFYFQRQHPYVYTARSLRRALEFGGCRVVDMLPYQRYGLANHMTWLAHGKPGGDAAWASRLADADPAYRCALERGGKTDTVIAIAERA